LSLSYYWTEQYEIRQQAQLDQQRVLQNLTHIAEESFLSNDDLLLVKYVHLLPKWNSAMVSASVVGPTGEILAHSEPQRIGQQRIDSTPNTSSLLVLSQAVRLGARPYGTASVSFSQQKLEEILQLRLAGLRQRLAIVSSVGLLLGLLTSFVMALSWTRPIKRLASGAEEVGKGKWDLDLSPLDIREDELGFLARAFQGMAIRLKELDQMKEDFVSSVTHELRSPLGAIESFLNLIDHERSQGVPPEAWNDYLHRIRLNTERLTRFVNDLLDVAALERGKVPLHSQAMDIGSLAKDILVLFELKLKEKRISIDLHCPTDLPNAWADPDRIHQVLINLVSNAVKFTPEGGRIDLSLEDLSPKKWLRVCVADTGMGIGEKDQIKIFNKFEQVHASKAFVKGPKGTGLGLSICRELIGMHGGEIGVTSRLGKGSTFFFTLPAAQTEVALALTSP